VAFVELSNDRIKIKVEMDCGFYVYQQMEMFSDSSKVRFEAIRESPISSYSTTKGYF
jgi:hypothetical protein